MINGGYDPSSRSSESEENKKMRDSIDNDKIKEKCEKVYLYYALMLKDTESGEFGYNVGNVEIMSILEHDDFPFYINHVKRFNYLKSELDESSENNKRIFEELADKIKPKDVVFKLQFHLNEKLKDESDDNKKQTIIVNEIKDTFKNIDDLYIKANKSPEINLLYDEIKKYRSEFYKKYPNQKPLVVESMPKKKGFVSFLKRITRGKQIAQKRKGGKGKTRKNKRKQITCI